MSVQRSLVVSALVLVAAASSLAAPAVSGPAAPSGASDAMLSALHWREVGPYRGGRVAAVAGIPQDRQTYYFGATGGGVWKTADGGATWKNVSDGSFGGSIGAVAVSAWDPNVVYVGGGEVTVRGNVSAGNGVWRSTDAGATWSHVGLADSRHVPRLVIHPKNPDLVYAAVLGHLWGPNAMRGVYRSRDGGATWKRVLFVNENAGAVDLAMDPVNPRILYASLWRVRRTPWELSSGGEGSGLWKTTDGGDTWKQISANPGFAKGTLGIIGITVSPGDHENLYAMVEAADGGVYRSRDGGATWHRVNGDRSLRQRAWYYSRIVADPQDADGVWVLNVRLHRSRDGGRTFATVSTPHGDNHALWIDPSDPRRMIEGNDGGANVTTDGGASWSTQANQPTAQIYRVSTDDRFPYRIYGAQQDNTALWIASRSDGRGISARDWAPTAGGESGAVVPDPANPAVVYGGSYDGLLIRTDHETGETRDVNVWPDNPMGWGAADLRYRFQWNFPLFFSPHDPKVLYAAAQVLFKTTDGGQSWTRISPDLTRNDKAKQGPSGGPITKDNTSVEYYDTIFAAAESPLEKGVLWAGSDDGLVHVSRDGGGSWQDVTPKQMPGWAQVNSLDPDPFHAGGLYVAATMYKLDDDRPYLFRTKDYGATWTAIDAGIPAGAFTRVVRADPVRPGLLYAGTEHGVFVSFDDGGHWRPLQLDLPLVPVTDLAVKGAELVAATQGRGFWILDGLAVLRQLDAAAAAAPAHLFAPSGAYRVGGGDRKVPGEGQNPPAGVAVYYSLEKAPAPGETVKLEFLAADGTVIRSFASASAGTGGAGAAAPAEAAESEEEPGERPRAEPVVPAGAGLNLFVWDMCYPPAGRFPGMVLWGGRVRGPRAVPGKYTVRLEAAGRTLEVPFAILADPRSSATQADLEAQLAFLLSVRDGVTRANDAVGAIRRVVDQISELDKRLGPGEDDRAVATAAKALEDKVVTIEKALYQTQNRSAQDPLNFPIRLNNKLELLGESAATGDYRPTDQAVAVKRVLMGQLDAQLEALDAVWKTDLPALNAMIRSRGVAVITPEKPVKEKD